MSNNLYDVEQVFNFTAKIEYVKFYNDENNYHIMEFSTDNFMPGLKKSGSRYRGILIGYAVKCIAGDVCKVQANFTTHPKFGPQYNIISLSFDTPLDSQGFYNFLSSVVNESYATILYNAYPDIVERVIENNDFEPDYNTLRGIGVKRWEKIKQKIIDNLGYAELISLLAPVGCTLYMIKNIAKGEKNISLLKKRIMEDPYILCSQPHMGFKKVDGFAIKINPTLIDSPQRVKACIVYLLEHIENEYGHSYIKKEELKKQFKETISEESALKNFDGFLEGQQKALENGKNVCLYVKDDCVGLARTYYMERYCFERFTELSCIDNIWELSYKTFLERMKTNEEKQGFTLSEEQADAVRSIAENNITVISGKAGTGKSSIIKAILEVYKDHSIGMAALSAKAAKRMREVTGFNTAMTIHRLLGYNGTGFLFNENCKLSYDLLILDECSMNNIYLFYSILKAVNNNTKIVLAGDFAQLPSIGVGSVFSDMIKYPYFNNHNLTKVYRQSEDSFIVEHANLIRDGIMPFDINQGMMPFGNDTLYIFKNDPEVIRDTAIKLYLKILEQTNIEDICIVVPRKDVVCVSCESINNIIQDQLIDNTKPSITLQNKTFKLGCRVINKKNDYDKGVLNGDMGTVVSINDDGKGFVVKTDEGDMIPFSKSEMMNLELGYAISVHSSQGSQYKTTIFAFDMSSYTLLSSNMVYTAMTRAIDKIIVISQPNAFVKAVLNIEENNRNTFMKNLLVDYDENIINDKKIEYLSNHRPCVDEDEIIINKRYQFNSVNSSPFDENEDELPF